MERFLHSFDLLCRPEADNRAALWLDRIIFAFVVIMFLAAPFSIAATQTAWLVGMFLWILRLFVCPRPRFEPKAIDIALWSFFIWAVISAAFSYEPLISLDKLRVVSVFLIFYFVYYNVRTLRTAYFLAFALIFAGTVAAAYAPIQKMLGRGVEVHGLSTGSILANAGIEDGFTLLRADGRKINSPEALAAHIASREVTRLEYYKPDFEFDTKIRSLDLPLAGTAEARLGIEKWTRGSVPRSTGLYGHWTTFSEALQLIASLALGIFAAGLTRNREAGRRLPLQLSLALLAAIALMCLAMLLTITRASQMGFMMSAFITLLLSGSRKLIFAAVILAIPVTIGAVLFLQQTRQVGVVDAADPSTQYRATMWRDGYRLWTDSPRNFIFGIGMDSTKRHWQEWGMFDGGRLPIGHFHSTPVQIAVERGLPALILWLLILGFYWQRIWQAFRRRDSTDIRQTGILLGSLAGSIGFFVSGFVHYNLGDTEVAMIFFMLMGLGIRVTDMKEPGTNEVFVDNKKLA